LELVAYSSEQQMSLAWLNGMRNISASTICINRYGSRTPE
jgi:hypothetical protein